MIDRLCDEAGEEEITVAGFYCGFPNQEEETAANIIGAILMQLVTSEERLEYMKTAFQKTKKELGGRGLRLPDMVQMANRTVATLPRYLSALMVWMSAFLSISRSPLGH